MLNAIAIVAAVADKQLGSTRGSAVNIRCNRQRGRGREGIAVSFGLYILGCLIALGGLIYGAVLLHVPSRWIVVGAIVLLGVAVLTGVKATRQKDPAT